MLCLPGKGLASKPATARPKCYSQPWLAACPTKTKEWPSFQNQGVDNSTIGTALLSQPENPIVVSYRTSEVGEPSLFCLSSSV